MQNKINLIAAVFITYFFLLGCGASKKQSKSFGGFYLSNQIAKAVDTTYEYDIYNGKSGYVGGNIFFTLPDSLGGKKVEGFTELYSMIDEKKQVVAFKITSALLYENGKNILSYNAEKDKEPIKKLYYRNFKNFLSIILKDIPFKQKVENAKGIHSTYCNINFKSK
jgi:hypothetical protein